MNKDEITKAVDTLAGAVKAEQEAEKTLKAAREVYDIKFSMWLSDNLDVAGSLDLAEEGLKAVKEIKATASKAVREIAPSYFEANPEARAETPGLSYRLERKPVLNDDFVMVAVKAGASFLLKPDDKAIKKFVQGMATQNKDTKRWSLPEPVMEWLDDSLQVKNDYVVTISEDKLATKADDSD